MSIGSKVIAKQTNRQTDTCTDTTKTLPLLHAQEVNVCPIPATERQTDTHTHTHTHTHNENITSTAYAGGK